MGKVLVGCRGFQDRIGVLVPPLELALLLVWMPPLEVKAPQTPVHGRGVFWKGGDIMADNLPDCLNGIKLGGGWRRKVMECCLNGMQCMG